MPGPKKAAHYSVPVAAGTPGGVRLGRSRPRARGGAWAARGVLLLAGALALVIWVSPSPGAPAGRPEADARKAEAELQSVKAEIERITREVSAEQVERDQLTTELKSAELSVGKVRAALAEVRRERAERAARRAELAAEKHQREVEVREKRAALAGQLRAAYTIGRQEPLKLLLNQKDPALAGRIFAYYGYFGRARAAQIRLIEEDVQRIAELEGQLDAEDQQLAELERQQRAQLHQLELSRVERSHVLASLEAQSHTRAQNLERLRSQQAGLEKLLRELRAAVERFPIEGNDVFTRLRGRLAWPVSGRVVARFGDARAGGVRWDGVLVATERGAPVKAVCQGRVIYADWLPGLGLLTIVDHGDGYLSLYGHNERLYKAAGRSSTSRSARAAGRSTPAPGSRPRIPSPQGRPPRTAHDLRM